MENNSVLKSMKIILCVTEVSVDNRRGNNRSQLLSEFDKEFLIIYIILGGCFTKVLKQHHFCERLKRRG